MKPVFCIGEILWDIIGEGEYLGGAPLNCAVHCAALGAEKGISAFAVSRVGSDRLGGKALETLLRRGVRTDFVTVDGAHPTGTAVVSPGREGAARFALPENAAYDFCALSEEDTGKIAALGPCAFVYGTLAPFRSGTVLAALESVVPPGVRRGAHALYDVNLRLSYFGADLLARLASMCTVLKLNGEELSVVSGLLFDENMDGAGFSSAVFARFPLCGHVVVTRGESGAEGFWRGGGAFSVPGIPVAVADTVGAGDAFSAGFLTALIDENDARAALEAGNRAGAFTASRPGGTPEYTGGAPFPRTKGPNA